MRPSCLKTAAFPIACVFTVRGRHNTSARSPGTFPAAEVKESNPSSVITTWNRFEYKPRALMVGFIDPNPPKPPERPPPPRRKWWKGMFTNPIQIKRPAQGKYSPKVDERCFTWCSQTARGRTDGQDAWCRSLCIRRVFEHEVRQLTSHFSHDAAHHSRLSTPETSKATTSASENNRKSPELKYPLPPEGQRKLFNFGVDDESDDDGDNSPSSRYPSATTNSNSKGKEKQGREVKYWEEGWYVWMTKNRWAAQEKMDLMMLDLEKQAHWQKVKEQEEHAWTESQSQAQSPDKETDRVGGGETGTTNIFGENGNVESHLAPVPIRHPYPNAAEESFLLRIPTHLSVFPYLSQVFQPTNKVLSIFKQSLDNGDQRDLFMRGWEAAREGVPFRLVKNVVRTCLESFKKGPRDEE
ncbi:hypothetical protein A7U60_g7166 [Sanghuangporus baumii]|uniref:Uncharacterized protein n=1 Tax=Sanghuangporus baumii TaxID=108892 RepID=A0A9Q5HTY6_SANBA|nr:hypothetical protein A7U60_g7166 [Sanghuangporus baumii]